MKQFKIFSLATFLGVSLVSSLEAQQHSRQTITAAYEVVEAYAQIQNEISSKSITGLGFVSNPCQVYDSVHSLAYDHGAIHTRYPRPDAVVKALAPNALANYIQIFYAAESVMAEVSDLAKTFSCGQNNNKCCDKSGATEKCKDSKNKKCELSGSISSCTSVSNNC